MAVVCSNARMQAVRYATDRIGAPNGRMPGGEWNYKTKENEIP
jgi:hypothetical protein